MTASNDTTAKIWDVRYLSQLSASPEHELDLPSDEAAEELASGRPPTWPTSSIDLATVQEYSEPGAEGAGLERAVGRHGKSCSSAVWDPYGRRVLTTSYDDHLRVWHLPSSSPSSSSSSFKASIYSSTFPPLAWPPAVFPSDKPSHSIAHDCQTGRWLSILRAQWSQNTDVGCHFTVGNMKRSLDVYSAKGALIARLFDPDLM